ncbi:MAG: sugar transferase, partial [Ruminococcus sp.]|nr:sugar transferase [Candidatus Apopatosoma intestinale]
PFITQLRPGKIGKKTGEERLFKMIKFRTMSNAKDKDGNLLPDEARLNGYGRFLRKTSLDELPELINILIGHMAIVGPRPQLVRDMVFMTAEQRLRHTVRPGLTGLAQISGRNAISWDNKLATDLVYIKKITVWEDMRILLKTVGKVLKSEGITEDGEATATDLGDYLLKNGTVSGTEYEEKQKEARRLMRK